MSSEVSQQKLKEWSRSPKAKAWFKAWKEYWKYNLIVPPQVFDFLRSTHSDLGSNSKSPKEYTVYTRKAKGSRTSNPSFKVDKKMFKAINTLITNLPSSILVPSSEIRFYPDTCELRIWGFHVYIKKDSDRFRLCKYMFGKQRHAVRWEVEDLVERALEESYEPSQRKKYYDRIISKFRELNKDIKNGIGFEDFIISEEGAFVINPVNIPKIN